MLIVSFVWNMPKDRDFDFLNEGKKNFTKLRMLDGIIMIGGYLIRIKSRFKLKCIDSWSVKIIKNL